MILANTSVWIDYFRKKEKTLAQLLYDDKIITCGIILLEIIPFLHKTSKECENLLRTLARVDVVLHEQGLDELITNREKLIAKGLHGIGIPDLIIMQTATTFNLPIYTKDKHFQLAAPILKFEIHNP
jgi:predicted nucleic acid-binding protein